MGSEEKRKIIIELKAILEFEPDPRSSKSIPEQMREAVKVYSVYPDQLIGHPKAITVIHGRDINGKT